MGTEADVHESQEKWEVWEEKENSSWSCGLCWGHVRCCHHSGEEDTGLLAPCSYLARETDIQSLNSFIEHLLTCKFLFSKLGIRL